MRVSAGISTEYTAGDKIVSMRVLFVSCVPLEHAVTRYRCGHLAEALIASGHRADVTWIGAPLISIDHDIVVLHRICANVEGWALACAVERSGATLVYGADDLVFDPSAKQLPGWVQRHAARHKKMIELAQGNVLTSTKWLLVSAIANSGVNWDVIGNFPGRELLESCIKIEKIKNEKLTIGYFSGSNTHDDDLLLIAKPLSTFLSENKEKVKLKVVGPVEIPEEILTSGVEIERLESVPWRELPALLSGCDVNLAPLVSDDLNRCKSAIKWQEAALVGVPTLASPVGELCEAIEHGVDGLHCATDADWEAALRLMLLDPARRASLGTMARQRVRALADVRRTQVSSIFKNALPTRKCRPMPFLNPIGYLKARTKNLLKSQ